MFGLAAALLACGLAEAELEVSLPLSVMRRPLGTFHSSRRVFGAVDAYRKGRDTPRGRGPCRDLTNGTNVGLAEPTGCTSLQA